MHQRLQQGLERKPFVWDGNNPIAYSDPSGFNPVNAGVLLKCASGCLADQVSSLLGVNDVKTLASKNASGAAKLLAGVALIGRLLPEARPVGELAEYAGLAKSLASAGQLGDAMKGVGTAIAGAGTSTTLRDAARLVSQYGGQAADWAKMSTSAFKAPDGTSIAVHWYENVATGLKVEFKSKQ